jgi:hypothetical protein
MRPLTEKEYSKVDLYELPEVILGINQLKSESSWRLLGTQNDD